jgi:uncharacterized protein (UPF0335 family)
VKDETEDESPGMGHNSGVDAAALNNLLERIEGLEEDRAAIASDIREIYTEAKSRGFNTKVMRQVLKLRKQDPHQRDEEFEILKVYLASVGIEF